MGKTGRPPSCQCGVCPKCKRRDYMRGWYNRKTLEERREWIAKRDPAIVRANDRARYRKHRDKRLELAKEWTRKNAEKVRETQKRWVEENRDKRRAHSVVARAVRSGKLVRQPCNVCGAEKVHAHHSDHSKPLEVEWLCPSCHLAHHGLERRID